jgi:hypothetical protein
MKGSCPFASATFALLASAAMAMPDFGSRSQVGTVTHPWILEQSGIVSSRKNPHILWIQVDSGEVGDDYIFAVTTNGACVGAYAIDGFLNADWEDIAIGPGPIAGVDYLYIADIGDNQSDDPVQHIARVPEPSVSPTQSPVTNTLYGADILTVAYEGGYMVDAESLIVDSNKNIYVITKRTGSDASAVPDRRLYTAAYPQSTTGTNVMSNAGQIPMPSGNYMPTGADIAPSGEQILIKMGGGHYLFFYPFGPEEVWHWEIASGQTIEQALIASPTRTKVTVYANDGQCEAVGWAHHDGGFYTISEGNPVPLYFYENQDADTWYWLGTESAGNGNGSIAPGDGWQVGGSNVTVTATPDARNKVAGWSGDTSGWTLSGNELSGTMNRDRWITVSFAEDCGPNTTNTLPYAESFETYLDGYQMPGANGWSAASLTDAVVTTNQGGIASYSASCGYPNSTAVHTKALQVNGTATNDFTMSPGQLVWLDFMMEANYAEQTSAENDAQAQICFNVYGHPMIWHRDLTGSANVWTEIAGFTATEGQWVRVTLQLDYGTVDAVHGLKYFQVRLDGTLVSNDLAWTSNDGSGSTGGSWFAMPSAPTVLDEILFRSGGKHVDDLVVTTQDPFAPPAPRGTLFTFR